ncbi:MAG: RNA polymerase sigma factor [Armatimonadetes bacterium]|nr:RNA polymerase sigma factor [Armatimonadota bacterium]
MKPEPRGVLERTYRNESRRIFARLVHALGDFDIAEDALQDATRAAAVQWPIQGVPENPAAWLFQTARFQGISTLKRRQRLIPLSEHEEEFEPEVEEVGDEILRLIFTCCHPAISPDSQVALTLREVCELTTEEIASAYLTPTPTIAQRIVRAKSKIREASIPFEIPSRDELPTRLESVLKTIYLVFNEGYAPTSGKQVIRPELMTLAVHLGRQVVDLQPDPDVLGLLALMLVHQARSRTRTSAAGEIILLADQDRSQWDRTAIAEASTLVAAALRSGNFGPYSIQAAIATVHAEAPSYEETDWAEIIGLYDLLVQYEPSPVALLNRAVAIAMRDGPGAGIVQIDQLLKTGMLVSYHRAYAARAELFSRSNEPEKARADYKVALTLATQEPEILLIKRRLSENS